MSRAGDEEPPMLIKTEPSSSTLREPSFDLRQKVERLSDLFGATHRSADSQVRSLPFAPDDMTAGSENEYQTAVLGTTKHVDLPITLETSNFYKNLVKRTWRKGPAPAKAGIPSKRGKSELESYLAHESNSVWENSWVRFAGRTLGPFARQVLQHDLLADKKDPAGPSRRDIAKVLFDQDGEEWVRVPISYLSRLALADVISGKAPSSVRRLGERLMDHFLNDNTSPETCSFYIMNLHPDTGMGRAVGKEASQRFLLSHLLTMYANRKFELLETGQRAVVYFAPHPPIRQKRLNNLISDNFYRELFMNPCLSGWDSGQDKYEYMRLCHEVLSRSHQHVIGKLKDAGIITRNLVVPTSPSNISLANNGTHVSLGSRKLTQLSQTLPGEFTPRDEKCFGDLVTKVIEHFLPLFVGTYSAAPYRLDFWDFHPENVLGFLPHELDHQFLRLLWQRWKRKASLRFFGKPITPMGPVWLDKVLGYGLGMRGDYIPDFRLVDYLVVLPSTEECPALDGTLGNDVRLKRDLAEQGIYDERMSFYQLYKLRTFSVMGFSGFEGRYYSLFESLLDDMGEAASLQAFLTALAFKYLFRFEVHPSDVPDDPATESERRQIFFGAAVNLPTFYVRADTSNQFLKRVLARTSKVRLSRRFPSYYRVHHREYRQALLTIMREDGADLIEAFQLHDVMGKLKDRLENPDECSAFGKLTKGILHESGATSPFSLSGEECNTAAETYYRQTLRTRHLGEAIQELKVDCAALDACVKPAFHKGNALVQAILGPSTSAQAFLERIKPALIDETIPLPQLTTLIHLLLITLLVDEQRSDDDESEID